MAPSRPAPLRRYAPLALILALAAFLRLYQLDLIDLRFDEASALQSALGIARGQWLLVAPFSGSVANHPPVYLYLMALPYLFTREVLTVVAYRALLDVAAIGLCWLVCRRHFNVRVAHVAALLFAIAPWAVQYARKTWTAPLPLFSMLLLWGLLEVVQRRNPWGWSLVGLGLALCIGAHLSGLFLLPVVLIALVMGFRTLRWRPVLMGLVPLVLLAAAYLSYDAGHDFANVRALLGRTSTATSTNSAAQMTSPLSNAGDALRFTAWLSGGAHLSDLTGPSFADWTAQSAQAFSWLDDLQQALFWVSLVGVLACAILVWRQTQRRNALLIVLTFCIVPAVWQLRSQPAGQPLQQHYFTLAYPAQFVLMALAADAVFARGRQLAQQTVTRAQMGAAMSGLVAGLIVLIGAWQVFSTLRFYEFVQQHVTYPGGYGPSVRQALQQTQLASAQITSGQFPDVIVVAPGGDPLVNEPSTVMDALLAGVPHRFVNADVALILREGPAQYLFMPNTQRALLALRAETNVSADAADLGENTSNVIHIETNGLAAHAYEMPAALTSAAWANGVQGLGYTATKSLDQLHLQIYLRVTRRAEPGTDVHWFNHVLVNDAKMAQADGGGVHPANWREGDILLQWFDVPVPAAVPSGPYALRIGCYTYPQLAPVMLIDAAGNPSADSVTFPLVVR